MYTKLRTTARHVLETTSDVTLTNISLRNELVPIQQGSSEEKPGKSYPSLHSCREAQGGERFQPIKTQV